MISLKSKMARTFLTIPTELRLNIFKHLFRLTTVRHGFPAIPVPFHSNHISILQTTRQIHDEAKPLFIANTSFHFSGTEAMLDTLSKISQDQIRQIRHIRVKAFPFPLYASQDAGYYTTYNFSSTLGLFPGLQLDQLVVEDCYHDEGVNDGWGDTGTYFDVESLITSDGWRELEYISPTTEFLPATLEAQPADSDDSHVVNSRRVPQPACWNKVLQEQDGDDSGVEVLIRVAKEARVTGATKDTAACDVYTADMKAFPTSDRRIGDAVDWREVRVIAKRGRKASYVQDGGELEAAIRNVFDKMTWEEVKESDLYHLNEGDPCAHL